MAVLKNLGVRNLRSLKNIEPVPISPITVLIGKNSVGKSTFARIFPLIRQSVERKKKSPNYGLVTMLILDHYRRLYIEEKRIYH